MRLLPRLTPVTKRRLQRFRSLKRAYWSFWILVGLYVFSMLADVICNNVPLLVKYNGSFYFPLLSYHPESEFKEGGEETRPDFKVLAKEPQFANSESNYIVFPPIPYGSNESIDQNNLDIDNKVYLEIARQQLVGSIDLQADLTIRRSSGAASFFGVESERDLRGYDFGGEVELSVGAKEAVAKRLANETEEPAFQEIVTLANDEKVEWSLSPYKPRSRPPTGARVTLREILEEGATDRYGVEEDGSVLGAGSGIWNSLTDALQAELIAGAVERYEKALPKKRIEVNGLNYQVEFDREDVFFPFRPVKGHPWGLDGSGRDVLVRIIYACRIALNFGLLLVTVTLLVGIIVGAVQGYFGGKTDLLGQRFIEIWSGLPFLYVMIFLGSVWGRSFWLLLLVYGIFNWIGISYYMRGEFLKLRKLPFVEASHCLGLPSWKIMLRHMLPNALVPVITFFPFMLVGAIASLSALDYLGFGMPPPTPSWGEMLSQAQEFKFAWWLVLYPSLALFVVVLLGVFVGEGIRAAFDPRVNSRFES